MSHAGLALAFLLCSAAAPAPATPPAKDKPMDSTPAPQRCLAELAIDRGQSPWQGYTSSAEEEASGKHVAAVADLSKLERVPHLAKYDLAGKPLLAIDRERRRVVVSGEHFGDLERADGTRSGVTRMGTVHSAALKARPRELVLFLVEAQLVQTYWHLEAKVCLDSEEDGAKQYRARLSGTHLYFTSRRNEKPLSFQVTLDKATGALTVEAS
ncbi:MAG TPA: hypothetical protein VGK67_24835 [Myxococcales bacterium]|jgi:hypothetical protein